MYVEGDVVLNVQGRIRVPNLENQPRRDGLFLDPTYTK